MVLPSTLVNRFQEVAGRTPFDAVGPEYDRSLENHAFTRELRAVVQETLVNRFPDGSHVLDLGCGTGTDAVMLAERGLRITAVDSSAGMLECAGVKVSERRLQHLVSLKRLDIGEIDRLGGTMYEGAFSNFGALNCLPDLQAAVGKIARLLVPGAPFISCVLNRICLWEISGFALRGQMAQASRRLRRGGIEARVGSAFLPVWYYSPAAFTKILSPWFQQRETYGLSILSPTLNSQAFACSHPELTRRLQRLDGRIRRINPFRSMGDHFVMIAERIAP